MKMPEPLKVFYVTGNTSLLYKFRGFDAAILPAPTPEGYYWCIREKDGKWVLTEESTQELQSKICQHGLRGLLCEAASCNEEFIERDLRGGCDKHKRFHPTCEECFAPAKAQQVEQEPETLDCPVCGKVDREHNKVAAQAHEHNKVAAQAHEDTYTCMDCARRDQECPHSPPTAPAQGDDK